MSSSYQHYRKAIGNHTNWQDKRLGSQKHQDNRVQRLSKQPGLHSGNIHRQNTIQAVMQLLSILSSAQSSSVKLDVIQKSRDEESSLYQNNRIQKFYSQTELHPVNMHRQYTYADKYISALSSQKYNSVTPFLPSQINLPDQYQTLGPRKKRVLHFLYQRRS
jgi:hypothetical protein